MTVLDLADRLAPAVGDVQAGRILIVDDEEPIRRSLGRVLERAGYSCYGVGSAAEALETLAGEAFDLVLTDVNMPGETGLWLAGQVGERYPGTAVVMVTGVDETALARVALEMGAYGYVIKPFEANEIVINVFNALRRRSLEMENRRHRDELSLLVAQRTAALEESLRRLADTEAALRKAHQQAMHRLAVAAEYHDPTTGAHIQRMSMYSAAIAAKVGLGMDEAELIRLASPMHDIGKIGIPDEILQKPGKLTDGEMDVMRDHPRIGYDLLSGSGSDLLELAASIALSHHEKWNGTGYPDGRAGTDIPLEGRIVALADVFDALTSERPYKRAFGFDESLDIIRRDSGTHFDPELVEVMVSITPELAGIARAHGSCLVLA